MFIARKIKSAYRLIKRNFIWEKDAKECREDIKSKSIGTIPEGKLIILMPHSDDEWIGCSTILKKYAERVLVVNMNMKGGDDKKVHKERLLEAENVAQKVGYHFITIGEDKIKSLQTILKSEEPICVFLPSFLDWHEEHLQVMNILKSCLVNLTDRPKVAMYQVSLPLPEYFVTICISLTKMEWKSKWSTFKSMYKTQAFLPVKRFALNEYINGAFGGNYAAEVFSISDYEKWENDMNRFRLSNSDIKVYKEHLQEIKYTRNALNNHINSVLNGEE